MARTTATALPARAASTPALIELEAAPPLDIAAWALEVAHTTAVPTTAGADRHSATAAVAARGRLMADAAWRAGSAGRASMGES